MLEGNCRGGGGGGCDAQEFVGVVEGDGSVGIAFGDVFEVVRGRC